jgi:hypothetical protein
VKKILIQAILTGGATLLLGLTALAQGPYPNPKVCSFYDSASTFNGQLVPVGSIVKAYDPNGVLIGVDTFGFGPTAAAGYYGFMPCYGDDPNTAGFDEGANSGDSVHFTINGRPATVVLGDNTWADQSQKNVRLSASSTIALSFVRTPNDTLATIDRVVRFTAVVRNDGDGTDFYAVQATNGNTDFVTETEASYVYAAAGDSAVLYFDIHTPLFVSIADDTVDAISFKVYSMTDTTKSVTGTVNLWMSITDVGGGHGTLPAGFAVNQNYPNPFNPTTTIGFALPRSSQVALEVYDILGRSVDHRDMGSMSSGDHQIDYDASSLSSGVYFYRIVTSYGAISRKMVLLK